MKRKNTSEISSISQSFLPDTSNLNKDFYFVKRTTGNITFNLRRDLNNEEMTITFLINFLQDLSYELSVAHSLDLYSYCMSTIVICLHFYVS